MLVLPGRLQDNANHSQYEKESSRTYAIANDVSKLQLLPFSIRYIFPVGKSACSVKIFDNSQILPETACMLEKFSPVCHTYSREQLQTEKRKESNQKICSMIHKTRQNRTRRMEKRYRSIRQWKCRQTLFCILTEKRDRKQHRHRQRQVYHFLPGQLPDFFRLRFPFFQTALSYPYNEMQSYRVASVEQASETIISSSSLSRI